jgi:hypothetical protein
MYYENVLFANNGDKYLAGKDDRDLKACYDKTRVFFEDDRNNIWEMEKPAFDVMAKKAYMWKKKAVRFMGRRVPGHNVISAVMTREEHESDKEFSFVKDLYYCREYVTTHSYAYPCYFKPDLEEVLVQLPRQIFEDFDEVYVSTRLIADPLSICCIGDRHVGVTTVAVRIKDEHDPHWLKDMPLPVYDEDEQCRLSTI